MKNWRNMAATIKRAMIKAGMHVKGARYGKSIRALPAPPVWRGGPKSMCAPSPLLSGLLKRQANL